MLSIWTSLKFCRLVMGLGPIKGTPSDFFFSIMQNSFFPWTGLCKQGYENCSVINCNPVSIFIDISAIPDKWAI